MAEKQAAENQAKNDAGVEASKSGGLLGKIWDFFTSSEAINAAARQGIDELGSALKAFPDAISVDRDVSPTVRAPWPSELAAQNRNQPVNDNGNSNGNENGHDAGFSM